MRWFCWRVKEGSDSLRVAGRHLSVRWEEIIEIGVWRVFNSSHYYLSVTDLKVQMVDGFSVVSRMKCCFSLDLAHPLVQ